MGNLRRCLGGQRRRRFAQIGDDRYLAETSSLVVSGEQTLDLSANRGVSPARVFEDGRALVHGTDDVARARSLYARYIGA